MDNGLILGVEDSPSIEHEKAIQQILKNEPKSLELELLFCVVLKNNMLRMRR